jgi:undecaprenyl-diphosphatase
MNLMNNYFAAVILGIIEGLTEFLPVSSTAHLRITQELLGLPQESEYWKMFAIVIQLGAILAVVAYFWKRLRLFIGDFWQHAFDGRPASQRPQPAPPLPHRPLWQHPLSLVLLAFVVTALPCFLIDEIIGEQLENLTMMAWVLMVGGIFMWLVDWWFSAKATTHSMEKMSWTQALFIGAMQIISAAFPGTSRSMATIAGGQMVGLSRTAALEFSFFLSIPVMCAATTFKLLQFVLKSPFTPSLDEWLVLAIGFSVSFVVALVVIAWFMNWVRRQGFQPFAIYRLLAGAILLFWLHRR